MGKLKIRSLTGYSRFLRIFIAVLGFSAACEDNARYYGMPSATYIIKGNVKSAKTAGNIPGIRVSAIYDSVQTDASGNYNVENIWLFPDTVYVRFRDTDSVINREYQELDTFVVIEGREYTGGDGEWYLGKMELDLDVKLKDKE
jgi:putative lipoprotein (rSAM/lipoprotein system)